MGRWSCGGANPEVEAIHARLKEEKRKKKALKRARRAKDADVDDEEMAAFGEEDEDEETRRVSETSRVGIVSEKKGENVIDRMIVVRVR